MVSDASEDAARQLLRNQPDLEFFYIIWRSDSDGSTGSSSFYGLATDPDTCRAIIQQLCAEQKAERDRIVAALSQLPEDEEPYNPLIPDGCSVGLYIVLPDKQHYVSTQGQRWYNNGQTFHSPLIPDIFDVGYYADKVRHGEYSPHHVKS